MWIVAIAAGIETLLEATIAAIAGRTLEMILWFAGTLTMIGAAFLVENVKTGKGE